MPGIAVRFRDHADLYMTSCSTPTAPLKGRCPDKGHGARLEPLPLEDPPAGLYTPAQD